MSNVARQVKREKERNQRAIVVKAIPIQAFNEAIRANQRIDSIVLQLRARGIVIDEDERTPTGIIKPKGGIGSTSMIGR